MQVTALTSGFNAAASSSYVTASITPTADRLVLAWIGSNGSGVVAPTLSGNGLTWVQVATVSVPNNTQLTLFRAMKPSGISAGAVTIAFTANQNRCRWSIFEVATVDRSGADGFGAVVASYSAVFNTSANSISVVLAAASDAANRPFAGVLHYSEPEQVTPRASWTEIHDVIDNGSLETQFRSGSFETTASGSWTTADPFRHIIAIEVKELQPEANLQAVATITADANIVHASEAALEAVATITANAQLLAGGATALQAVARITAEAEGVPQLDFTRYDAYIDDGTTLRGLIFFEGEGAQASDVSTKLRPVRTDTGLNPTEIRPESGDIFAQSDFSHGAGQLYFHHPGRDERKFLSSEGFDISVAGKLTHLRQSAAAGSPVGTSTTIGALAQAKGVPFVIDGTTIRRGDGAFPGTWTDDPPHLAEGAQTVHDIAASGDELYAAIATNGIHKRDTAGTWTHHVTQGSTAITRLAWVKDRLMCADGRAIYEITAAGALPAAIETLPVGWVFEVIFEAGGFIYAAAINKDAGMSQIQHYGLNTAGTAIVKKGSTQIPHDQLAYSGAGYLNTCYIGVGRANSSGGYDPLVYLGIPDPDTGQLQLVKLVEEIGSGAVDLSVKAVAPRGETVLFGWSLGSGSSTGIRDGLAIHHLARDAFAYHLAKTTPGAVQVLSAMVFKGRVLFALKGVGLYYEDLTKFVATATLIPSVADWANAGAKHWDFLEITHSPLPADTTIQVEYTLKLPEEASWNTGFTSSLDDSEGDDANLSGAKGKVFDLRFTSAANAGATAAPTLLAFAARSNPTLASPEYTMTRYIRVLDKDQKDAQAERVFEDPDAFRKALMALVYTWVTFYEPGVTWTARVESVGDAEALVPIHRVTLGEPGRSAFLMQLVLNGTRN